MNKNPLSTLEKLYEGKINPKSFQELISIGLTDLLFTVFIFFTSYYLMSFLIYHMGFDFNHPSGFMYIICFGPVVTRFIKNIYLLHKGTNS